MAGLPRQDVIKYAEFLVEVFPERVIDCLSNEGVCKGDDVARYCEGLWLRLGDEHTIKGHLMRREFNQLRAIKESRFGSSSTFPGTPVGGPHSSPITAPPSVASDSRDVHGPVHGIKWINVMQSRGPVQLTYHPSGSDLYFISQDKLHQVRDRQPTQMVERRVEVGGQYHFVDSFIDLSWYFLGSGRTSAESFWILPSGTIKDADVLIGSKTGEYSRFPGQFSHLALASHPLPHAPSPPMAPMHLRQGSSSGLASPRSMSASQFERPQHRPNFGGPPPFPHQPSAAMGFSASGSHGHSSPSFQYRGPTAIPESPSHPPQHEQANRQSNPSAPGTTPAPGNSVQMSFTFRGSSSNKRVRPISLAATATDAWDVINKVIKVLIPSGVDRSDLEFRVYVQTQPDTASDYYSLMRDDFLHCWGSVVVFINGHRATDPGVTPGFTFDIS